MQGNNTLQIAACGFAPPRLKPFSASASLALLTLLAILPLVGCSRIEHVYELDERLLAKPETRGVPLDLIYAAPDISRNSDEKSGGIVGGDLVVEVADPLGTIAGRRKIGDEAALAEFRERYERAVSDDLWATTIFHDVGTAQDEDPITTPTLRLEIAITEWHEGNVFWRWLAGTGAGATRVQTEGELRDARTGRVYFAFADNRYHPGEGSLALVTFRSRRLIEKDLGYQLTDLCRSLHALTGVEPPRSRRGPAPPRPSRSGAGGTYELTEEDWLQIRPTRRLEQVN